MIDIGKKNFLIFAKCLKMYSFFAFAFKVCKQCYYDPKKMFLKNINMGIKKTQNFMLISISEMPLTKVKSKKPRKNVQKRKYSKFALFFGSSFF